MAKLGGFLSTTACVAIAFACSTAAMAQANTADQPRSGSATTSPSGSNSAQSGADTSGVGETGLEEIVVTAQRRAQNLQEVPIAVSAFSATELENRGVSETLDLIQYVPNLFGSNNTGLGSANAYYLRGLGSTETVATFDPPVGTYIDDVYISRQNANNFGFFDVERVEVLRGPQGTLFGRNTTGGAVNVILKKPGNELGGFAEVGYGRFDKYMARGSIDLPMGTGVGVKLSGYYQDDKGYAKNTVTGDRLNDSDGAGLRGALRLAISDDISWNVSAAYIGSDGENTLNFQCNPADPTECSGRFISTGLRESVTGASQYAPLVISGRKANYDLDNNTDTTLVTSNLQVGLGDHTLNLITGVVETTQQYGLDFFDGRSGPNAGAPIPVFRGFTRGGFTILNDAEHKQLTQEIKLTGELFGGFVDYVTGFYYYDEDNQTDFADVFSIFTGAPGGTGLLLADRELDNETNANAAYAQADFRVTEQLTLTAGIRYTDEKKTFDIADNRASCNDGTVEANCVTNANLIAGNGRAIPRKQKTDLWTPRFAVNFEPNDDMLLFASATRGFKSGGWNARGTAANQLLPFGPEKVWNYEAGFKSDWWDNRLRFNVTAFYLDVAELQTPSALVNPVTGAITFLTRNFADYENKGLEVELNVIPIEGLNIYANAGYQDDKYKIDRSGAAADEFGIQSVAAQQAACLAQLAAGQIPGSPNTAPAGRPVNNAPACAAGIVGAEGQITEPVRTPDFTLSAGATYDIPIAATGFIVSPSVNVVHRSKIETGTSNLSFYNQPVAGPGGVTFASNPFGNGDYITGSEAKSHTLVNASLAMRTDDDNWLLAVECENCFGTTYTQSTLGNFRYINAPGTWMIRARRKF